MNEIYTGIVKGLPGLGLELPPERVRTMAAFGEELLEKNRVMNLTAITEPGQVARLHFLDSLTVLTMEELAGKRVIDVGCGGGFPGVPVAIACPEARVTLLDSLGKRMTWLGQVLPALGVQAECVTARAEEEAANRREQYDIALSRAVARLNILCELCMPYVKVGGCFLAMKGAAAPEELEEAKAAINTLGGRLEEVREFPVEGTAHVILRIRKVRPTPAQYPRRFGRIKQKPL